MANRKAVKYFVIGFEAENEEWIDEIMEAGTEEMRQRAKFEGWYDRMDWQIGEATADENNENVV